jgi:hypothetical protein
MAGPQAPDGAAIAEAGHDSTTRRLAQARSELDKRQEGSCLWQAARAEPLASSSRSQVATRTTRAAACLTWEVLSVDVRWRHLLSVVILTPLVNLKHESVRAG